MFLGRWNRVYFDADSGAGDTGSGGGASSAPAGAPAPDSPAAVPASEHNGVYTSDPGAGFEPSIDELKAGVKAHIAKEKSLAQPGADGKPAQPAVSQPPGAQATPSATPFSTNHYAWGNHFGLSQAQVDSFQTPAQFEAWVTRQQRMSAAAQPKPTANQPPARETQAQPPQPAAPPQAWGQFDMKDMTPEVYDEKIVGFVKHANERFAEIQQGVQPLFQMAEQFKQMAPLLNEFQQFRAQQQEQARAQTFQTIDKTLESVDGTLYGTGDPNKLGPAQLNARIAVSDVLARLEAGYNARGEALPPLDQLIHQAHAFAFSDRIKQAALAQASEKSKALRGQAVAVPTSREPKPLSSEERAQKAVAQKLKEFGDPDAEAQRTLAALPA